MDSIGEVSTLLAIPTQMTTRGSSATATGLALTMISVGAGVSSGASLVLLLSFAGVLAGASFIFVGVWMPMPNDDPTAPMGLPGVLAAGPWILDASVRVRELVHRLRRNLGLVGLLSASVAATATADRETGQVLCLAAFVLLLLGLSLLNVGVLLGEQQQELELEH